MEIKKIIKKKEVLIIVKNNLINVISSLNIRKVSSLPAAPYVLKILKGIKHLKY